MDDMSRDNVNHVIPRGRVYCARVSLFYVFPEKRRDGHSIP